MLFQYPNFSFYGTLQRFSCAFYGAKADIDILVVLNYNKYGSLRTKCTFGYIQGIDSRSMYG